MPAIRRRLWWVLLGLSIAIALLAAGDIVVGASFEPEGPPAIGGRILTAIATASPEASRVLDFRARMGGVSLLALGVLLAVLTWLHTGPASAGRGGRCACCPHGRSASSSSRCCMGWRLAKGSRRRCSQARSSRCSPEGPSFWTPDASSTRRGPAERRTATQLRCVADLVHGGNRGAPGGIRARTNNNGGWSGPRIGVVELTPARQATVTTTLPRLWSVSTYRWASTIRSNGYTRSMTALIAPDSTSSARAARSTAANPGVPSSTET